MPPTPGRGKMERSNRKQIRKEQHQQFQILLRSSKVKRNLFCSTVCHAPCCRRITCTLYCTGDDREEGQSRDKKIPTNSSLKNKQNRRNREEEEPRVVKTVIDRGK